MGIMRILPLFGTTVSCSVRKYYYCYLMSCFCVNSVNLFCTFVRCFFGFQKYSCSNTLNVLL